MEAVVIFGFLAGVSLPPPEFDRPYSGTLVTYVMPIDQIANICGYRMVGCAMSLPGRCVIFLPAVEAGVVSQPQQDRIRRHEIGHCNGWSSKHDGQRAVADADDRG